MRVGSKLLGYRPYYKEVACPFFRPLKKAQWSEGRAPLRGIFEGQCERGGTGDATLCNFGYARGLCHAFPSDAPVDAVRFSVASIAEGVVRLVWILEKDHEPMDHGVLQYQESTGEFLPLVTGVFGQQARIFIADYVRRLP